MVAPKMRSLSALITIFMRPLVSARSIARATYAIGTLPIFSDALGSRLSLSHADAAELGVGVERVGDDAAVDVAVLPLMRLS